MSAAENKRIMQEIFGAVDRDERRRLFLARLSDDVTMEVTGSHSWSQVFRGRERVLADLYGYLHTLLREPGRTDAFRFIADGDWVVVEAKGDMVRADGTPYRNDYCLLYRLAGGRIVEMKEYQDSLLCERILGPYPPERKRP